MKIFFSSTAEKKLLELNSYLLETWGDKVRKTFVRKVQEKIAQISQQPESCPKSELFPIFIKL